MRRPQDFEPGRVLVADDSAVMRAVLRVELTGHGWEVVEARDGVEALELARAARPEVVLLDIEMPRMNGFQVLAELCADPELADVPVIFLTARSSGSDVAEGLRRGAHDYLRKPFEPVELLARLILAHRMKRLRDELRSVAMTDVVTGLRNRRWMQDQLASLVSLHRRHDTALTALLLDLDHFKGVNDEYGHAAGDLVLRQTAARLAGRLRAEDAAARWGGEEFLVLLPGTSAADGATLAEDIRALVAAPMGDLRVTASIGVAALGPGDLPEDLVRRADAALYAAKDAGRDTVRLAPAPVAG